jgi:hypothetical protein
MTGLDAGYRYPGIVRAGIHLVLDPPVDVEIRVDAEGVRKAQERRATKRRCADERRASGIHDLPPDMIRRLPPIKTIHLQWFDTSHEPVWRDTSIRIDLEKRRFHQIEGWLIGQEHHGSGAIGVMLFSAPVLAVISPYLFVRATIYRSKERKQGMSRHGISLLKKLKGQLDLDTEALLAETFRNEWTHHLKMDRKVRFDDAPELLLQYDLTLRVGPHEHAETPTLIGEFMWKDDEGDLMAHAQFVGESLHFMRVLISEFEEEQAKALITCYRSCRIVSDEEH